MTELNTIKYETDSTEYLKSLPDNFFDLVILDPPGNKLVRDDWDNQWKTEDDYIEWLVNILKECSRVLKSSGSLYCFQWIGEKNPLTLAKFLMEVNKNKDLYFKDMVTWQKQRGFGNKRGWLYTREELFWYVKDNKKFIWNKEHQYSDVKRLFTITGSKNKSEYKRHTNIWNITEVGFGTCPKNFSKERNKNGKHSTPKPKEIFERIINVHTKENDNILIPFSGTGIVEDVCRHLGRNFLGVELNKRER